MHSMVGAFTPYTIKQRRVEIVRGYCYRFLQCTFPCGLAMLIFSLLLISLGASQLIYIFHFNGCNALTTIDVISISSSTLKCNRQTMKVLGITFIVSGLVLLFISLLVTIYSRSSEENNVIRVIGQKSKQKHYHHPHHPPAVPTSEHDPNHIIVSMK